MKKAILLLTCTVAVLFTSMQSNAQFSLSVGINVTTAPPPLPAYTQPPCPVDGYLWSPGYWAWDDEDGYYWVPGVWIMPPQPGYLWTPGYWGYTGGAYGWHGGYWATHVGFYGGVNYGYGYGGSGFYGGRWEAGHYRYNTAVVQVNQTVVRNTYVDRTVINNTTINNTTVNNRVSYNGGSGISAKPTASEQQAMHETHVRPTTDQITHNQTAAKDRNQFAVVNKGRPQTAAMDKPGGGRFDMHGKNAPAPVARPAGRMNANGANANNNPVKTNNATPGNNQPNATKLPGNQPVNANNNKPGNMQPNNARPHNNQPVIDNNNAAPHRDNAADNAKRNNDNNNRAMHPQPNQVQQQNVNRQQHTAPVPRQQSQAPRPQNQPPHQPAHQPNPMPRNNPPHNDHPQGEHHR